MSFWWEGVAVLGSEGKKGGIWTLVGEDEENQKTGEEEVRLGF